MILQLRHEPAALILTRQALPTFDRTRYAAASGLARGGYVLARRHERQARRPAHRHRQRGLSSAWPPTSSSRKRAWRSRVVSLPSWELFEEQPQEYRDTVLPPSVTARVCVEQGSAIGWARYAGATGQIIGMRTFGASAPLKDLQKKFGFAPESVVAAAKAQLAKAAAR